MSRKQTQKQKKEQAEQHLTRQEREHQASQIITYRTLLLMAIFGIGLFIPLGIQLFRLQVLQHDTLQTKATRQQTSDVTLTASRGSIYDTNGKTLAVSTTVYNIIISPKDINTVTDKAFKAAYPDTYSAMSDEQRESLEKDMISERIDLISNFLASEIDGVEAADVVDRCGNVNSQYSCVAKKVDADIADEISAFIERYDLDECIYMTTDAKRYYPYSNLASQVIGFVDSSNSGSFGVELSYDDLLSGVEGRVVTAKNSAGTDLLYYFNDNYDVENGESVYLTIDTTIQYYCEQMLEEGIEKYNVKNGGWCIAMDPNTGEILGMASSPTYDLNNTAEITDSVLQDNLTDLEESLQKQVTSGEITQEEADEQYNEQEAAARITQWTNRAINTTYEPGSTFKSMVLAAGLEEGVIDENSMFQCNGYIMLDEWKIRCSSRSGHGSLSLAEAVGKSCNMAFVDIGQKLGADTFWDYLEAFGITSKSGVDLPNEGVSQVWDKSEFTGAYGYVDLAVASFGQRFTVTPISLISGVASTINGGYLYEPHIVKSIADGDGNVVEDVEPTVVRQVVSEDTSEEVRSLLEGVVSTYTGKNAYQAGYRIGGKTGTAQKTSGDDDYVVSFVGFAPANDPKIIVLLAFDCPEVDVPDSDSSMGSCGITISGGAMAAPLAGELIAEICDYMGVDKQYTSDEEERADSTMPSVIGFDEDQAAEACTQQNLSYEVVGDGDTVTAQVPAAGTTLASSSTVTLYMGAEVNKNTVAMPDLSGLDKYDARVALEEIGLFYRASGVSTDSDVACDGQSIEAGTEVTIGTVVTAHFSAKAAENTEATVTTADDED